MEVTYFYEQGGQPAGPLAADQLMASSITASTLVWREGFTDWVPAGSVPELQRFFHPPVFPAPLAAPVWREKPPTVARRSSQTGKIFFMGLVVLGGLGGWWLTGAEPSEAAPTQTNTEYRAQDQPEEIKEIGYAANHLEEVDAAELNEPASEVEVAPAASDVIESIDNDNGILTIRYASGQTRQELLGSEKDWFLAYSPQLIVLHNERRQCLVRDQFYHRLAEGTTPMDGEVCTGLHVVGERIFIDVESGNRTHQELYNKHLTRLQLLPSHKN